MNLLIQPALREQCAELAQLHSANFPRGWSETEFASFFERDDVIALMASVKGKPVGFIFCWAVAGESELLALAVDHAQRRKGIARRLLELAMTRSKDMGANVMHLEVGVNNDAAQALYQSYGFQVMIRRKAYYRYPDGTVEDAITMRCEW